MPENSITAATREEEAGAETLASISAMDSPPSIPHFLNKVYSEIKATNPTDHQLLIMAVHSVFLEFGFVSFDPTSKIHGVHLPEDYSSRICYTIPDLLNSDCIETVVLKLQILGDFVCVYGNLRSSNSEIFRATLDAGRFVPSIEFLLKNEKDGNLKSNHERIVFEFWRMVKDRLSLPLLVSLCGKTGLPSPPCFMKLPTDLKILILERLPGLDIARAACVCSELRYLASKDDLWRNKFGEEFGDLKGLLPPVRWKDAFARRWKKAKRRKFVLSGASPHFPVRGFGRVPFGAPRLTYMDDDYHQLHRFHVNIPHGPRWYFRQFPATPHCNFSLSYM